MYYKCKNQSLDYLTKCVRTPESCKRIEDPSGEKSRDQILQQRNYFFNQIIHSKFTSISSLGDAPAIRNTPTLTKLPPPVTEDGA